MEKRVEKDYLNEEYNKSLIAVAKEVLIEPDYEYKTDYIDNINSKVVKDYDYTAYNRFLKSLVEAGIIPKVNYPVTINLDEKDDSKVEIDDRKFLGQLSLKFGEVVEFNLDDIDRLARKAITLPRDHSQIDETTSYSGALAEYFFSGADQDEDKVLYFNIYKSNDAFRILNDNIKLALLERDMRINGASKELLSSYEAALAQFKFDYNFAKEKGRKFETGKHNR